MNQLPVKPAVFLIPRKNIDYNKWAVVACDQHTANPLYWEKLKSYISDSPSTLNLILPECFLGQNDGQRVKNISECAEKYQSDGLFTEYEGFVCVERLLSSGRTRRGLVVSLDLEQYGYTQSDELPIRASEKTVIERLPPRVRIRRAARLELPHIMLLIDDSKNLVFNAAESMPKAKLYDFDLNAGGGHIKGGLVSDTANITEAFRTLLEMSVNKYGKAFLFAVGDGNHSLAAAKMLYEEEKSGGKISRFALAEVVNIYDESLDFEPIHRIVFDVDNKKFLDGLQKQSGGSGAFYSCASGESRLKVLLPDNPISAIETVEKYIDGYIKANGGRVDYIHGENETLRLAKEQNAFAILLNSIDKSLLFPYIAKHGTLPKKSFSMGHAEDKRYYIEAAKIENNT